MLCIHFLCSQVWSQLTGILITYLIIIILLNFVYCLNYAINLDAFEALSQKIRIFLIK